MREVKLGDIAKIITGKLDANAANEGGLYPFFTCSRDILRINKYAYDCECILVAGNGDLNVKYYKGKFNAYQRTYIIEIKEGVDYSTIFIYWFLQLYIETLRKNSVGSTIKYIKIGDLTNIKLPIVPLSEQERIVALLDDQFAKIDALKANAASQLQAAKNLFQSALKEMLTPKEGWVKDKFGNVCKYYKNQKRNEVLPYIGLEHIEAHTGELLSFISSNEVESGAFTYKKGFVLYGRLRPYLQKVIIAPFDGCCSTELFPIVSEDINNKFLKYWLISDKITDFLNSTCSGCRMPRANMNQLLLEEISFPSLSEQERIAARLDAISEKVKALQANYDQTINLCNDLKQSLLKSIFE